MATAEVDNGVRERADRVVEGVHVSSSMGSEGGRRSRAAARIGADVLMNATTALKETRTVNECQV